MSIIVQSQRIRLALDVTQWFTPPTDLLSGASVKIQNGCDLQFELAFFYGQPFGDPTLVNAVNWSPLSISLKQGNPNTGNSLWSESLAVGSQNAGLTYAAWQAGTDQNAVFVVAAAMNSMVLADTEDSNFWIVISAVTTDSPSKTVTLAAFKVTVMDTGAQNLT